MSKPRAEVLRAEGASDPGGAAPPAPAYSSDEAAVARWAAWYEGLPAPMRDALDDLGRGAPAE